MKTQLSNKELIAHILKYNKESLYLAIADLSPAEIEAISMRFWENHSIAQIADVLCVTWDEADAIIENALAELRRKLESLIQKSPLPRAA